MSHRAVQAVAALQVKPQMPGHPKGQQRLRNTADIERSGARDGLSLPANVPVEVTRKALSGSVRDRKAGYRCAAA